MTQKLREAAFSESTSLDFLELLSGILLRFELHFPLNFVLTRIASIKPVVSEQQFYHLVLSSQAIGDMHAAKSWLKKLREQACSIKGLDLLEGHWAKAFANTEIAQESYHRFINENPHLSGMGFWSLCDLKGYTFNSQDYELIRTYLKSVADPVQIALLKLSLSKFLHSTNKTEDAGKLLQDANNLISKIRPFQAEPYKQLVYALSLIRLSEHRTDTTGERLIFICGLPRSGTTLIEQILVTDPTTEATNELPFIERIALQLQIRGQYPSGLENLSQSQLHKFQNFYLSQISDYADNKANHLIDKNPNNFLHYQLIKTLFPLAKVINVLRPVRDNIIALYRQHFMTGNDYAYNVGNIVTYIEGYYRLLEHYQKQDNAPFIIDYEKLVTQPEVSIRKLFEYCDLPFTKDALEFYKQKSPVLTPSASQVRQPINSASIGVSKDFDNLLSIYDARIKVLEKQRSKILGYVTE